MMLLIAGVIGVLTIAWILGTPSAAERAARRERDDLMMRWFGDGKSL